MKFDIEQYKRDPKRKLILQNLTNQGPKYWEVEEIQIGLGDILLIKVPCTECDFSTHASLDTHFNLVHEIHGKIGRLEFANEKLNMFKFIVRLMDLKVDCSIDFSCHDENEAMFGVTKLKRFDSVTLLFNKLGGGYSFCYDLAETVNKNDLESFLEVSLEDYFEKYIYIDTKIHRPELWGVTFEHENIDGIKFRTLATSDGTFFKSRAEAEQWIKDHPDNNFDINFDQSTSCLPSPVLIDRWSLHQDGSCIRHI